jgi:hypothetical protein
MSEGATTRAEICSSGFSASADRKRDSRKNLRLPVPSHLRKNGKQKAKRTEGNDERNRNEQTLIYGRVRKRVNIYK